MTETDLSGTWTLRDVAGTHAVPMTLPGDAISALHQDGVLPDPYWGRNEYDCRWVAERDWVLSRSFTVETLDLDLVIDQLDTVAEIRLNGALVLTADNAFRRHRVDVSSALRLGENVLQITFPSAIRIAAERQAAQPFPVPYQADNCPIPNPNMLRKPQCDFGWDWNIALAPFGIYGEIRLVPRQPLRIERIAIRQDHGTEVSLHVTLHLIGQGEDTLTLEFNGETRALPAAPGPVTTVFQITEPQLWWPAGHGDQPLYPLTARLGGEVETRRIGLRTIELVTEPDEIGASFALHVNGVPIFCKGANWIPADALPSRITPEKTHALLQSAVDANMNMVRVWGGGRYEPTSFYDTCDALGLLVWQDFMFACALYPSDEAFLTEIQGEVAETVARLQHHACLALWCGDNENVGALNWFEESRANRDRYLAAYDRLNVTVERALKATDPGANWWPSSPSRGRLDFGDGWHDDTTGDMHFWSVWHEGRDFDHYRDVAPRFCSEFGFQSYPSLDQIKRFAGREDWNIAAPVFESHQKNAGGNARIAETMFRLFRFPEGFENFVYLSQVQQALAIKTAVTHWRAQKPRSMGTLYWQLNDTWPVCSWSSLDYGGGWKLLHHAAQGFYAPVICTILPREDRFDLVAVSDAPGAVEVEIELHALSMTGDTHQLEAITQSLSPDAAQVVRTLPAGTLEDDEVLLLRWRVAGGGWVTDHHAPRPYKLYDLPDPALKLETSGTALRLSAERPAFFTAVEADVPGRFSANGVLVLPDAPVQVTFTPEDPSAAPRFTLRHLQSATYSQN